MRTALSAADLDLIRRVREDHGGVEVSAAQLERWRYRGLLPRVQVVRARFGGTTVPRHAEEVVHAAALLGRISRSGRPWQRAAERLFNDGYSVTPKALTEAAAYLVSEENEKMREAWEAAKAEVPLEGDPHDDAGMVGEAAAKRIDSLRRHLSPKRLRNSNRRESSIERVVRREIELAHKNRNLSEGELQDYVGNALTWRMVDLVEPGVLSEEHRNLARHGIAEPMKPIGQALEAFGGAAGGYPLPSERLVAARSLTVAEAELYRRFAQWRIDENPALGGEDFGLLWVTTWIVAFERLKTPPHKLDLPLPQSQLDRAAAWPWPKGEE